MKKLTEKQVKKFWEKEIVPFLPDEEEKWEDLPEYEKKEIAKMAEGTKEG